MGEQEPSAYELHRAIDRLGELQACCEKGEPWASSMWEVYAGGLPRIAEDLRIVREAALNTEG